MLRHWIGALAFLLAVDAAHAFDLQGHRGARGLAPENTLAGFRTALAQGATTLELDLVVTRDGAVVIHHDLRLNPATTRDAQGRWVAAPLPALRELTLAQLQAYDVGRLDPSTRYGQTYPGQQPADGERIPTLDALFTMLREAGDTQVRFNLETKLSPLEPALTPEPAEFVRLLLEVVDRHRLRPRVIVQSFDWRTLREVQRQAPDVAIAALTARLNAIDNLSDPRWTAGLRLADHGDSVPDLVKALGAPVWSPFHGQLDETQLRRARELGLKVIPWTVNDPARMGVLLGWGVDGIITDYPDRLQAELRRRGSAPAR